MKALFCTANGHTKETIIQRIRERFKGKSLHPTARQYGTVGNYFCAYRGREGTACAVGLYIPDGHPGCELLGGVVELLTKHEDLQAFMPFDDAVALAEFQAAHDRLPEDVSVSEQTQLLIDWVSEMVA